MEGIFDPASIKIALRGYDPFAIRDVLDSKRTKNGSVTSSWKTGEDHVPGCVFPEPVQLHLTAAMTWSIPARPAQISTGSSRFARMERSFGRR